MKRLFLAASVLIALPLASCEFKAKRPAEGPGRDLASERVAPLSARDFALAASAGPLRLQKAELLFDNDQSFFTKLRAIEDARPGEVVRLAYYIYTDDHSSSKMWKLVERKAREGVKFKILADFIANATALELLRWLASLPNVEVRVFNGPNDMISRDVLFLSKPCPAVRGTPKRDECSKSKWAEIAKNPKPDVYAKLLMAGLYAREKDFLIASLVHGAGIDFKKLVGGGAGKPEDAKKLLEFAKLLYRAKMKKDPIAMIKVAVAMKLYAADLNPVLNEITGRLPVLQGDTKSLRDWEHVTDFTHHKFLSVGERFLQLGGRNIENSYHMEHNPLIHRYIFDDVDLAITVDSRDGVGLIRSYENLWNFSPMVTTWSDLSKSLLVDAIVDKELTKTALKDCEDKTGGQAKRAVFADCLTRALDANAAGISERIGKYAETIGARAAEYDAYDSTKGPRLSWSLDGVDDLPASDLRNGRAYYVENLPFDKNTTGARERKYGVRHGRELEDGKYIHYVWDRGLEKVCAAAAKARREGRRVNSRVVFHSAYYLPAAQQLRSFAKMIDGTWDCGGVDVVILTNSAQTTDMVWINFFSKYQLTAFFNIYSQREDFFPQAAGRQARFRYFDYKKQEGGNISLHSKGTIFGDDIMIGSANGDVRSYYMDTNNALYLENVPAVAKGYLDWVDRLITDKSRTTERTLEYIQDGKTPEQTLAAYHAQDRAELAAFFKGTVAEKVPPKMMSQALDLLDSGTKFIYESTLQILHPVRLAEDKIEQQKRMNELAEKYDRLLQLM